MVLFDIFSFSVDLELGLQVEVIVLNVQFEDVMVQEILLVVIWYQFVGDIVMVLSFGVDLVVLLYMVVQVDFIMLVLFVDIVKFFLVMIFYWDQLIECLGLIDVCIFKFSREDIVVNDLGGMFWMSDMDVCCYICKVVLLVWVLNGFEVWIFGCKWFQSVSCVGLEFFEIDEGWIKINLFVDWIVMEIFDYVKLYDLLLYLLVVEGYLLIGCLFCIDKVVFGEDLCVGCWWGQEKIECGIYWLIYGKEIDGSGI